MFQQTNFWKNFVFFWPQWTRILENTDNKKLKKILTLLFRKFNRSMKFKLFSDFSKNRYFVHFSWEIFNEELFVPLCSKTEIFWQKKPINQKPSIAEITLCYAVKNMIVKKIYPKCVKIFADSEIPTHHLRIPNRADTTHALYKTLRTLQTQTLRKLGSSRKGKKSV